MARGQESPTQSMAKSSSYPSIQLAPVGLADRERLAALMDDYLAEMVGHREHPIGSTSSRDYRYFDAYFTEPCRHAFFLCDHDGIHGFALLRGPESTGTVWHVAEFYVMPASRRGGRGRAAAAAMWRRFPGDWELQIHLRNSAALHFWRSCVAACAHGAVVETAIESDDGRRIQLDFRVDAPVADRVDANAEARDE
jgi:predicted acetyltransferase